MSANDELMGAWLRALAVLAWADGQMHKEEAKRLSVDAVSFAGMDLLKIEAFFDEAKALAKDPEAVAKAFEPLKTETMLEGLPRLKRCYELAMSDGKEDPSELHVIEQIASQFVPSDKLSKIIPWLRATRQAALLESELLPRGNRPPPPPAAKKS
jgi:tellurite resistance protein